MTALTRPRGPLPARTYWVRRLLVVGTAVALAVGVGQLLSRGSDGSSGPGQAVQVAATPSSTAHGPRKPARTRTPGTPTKTPLAQPSGPCEADDVVVIPVIDEAAGGFPVRVRLRLSTRVSPACYWHVATGTTTLKISTDGKDVWSSQECRGTMPTRDVVLRQSRPVWVAVTWSAMRYGPGCQGPKWALPGRYHAEAAALGGEPAGTDFLLLRPVDVVTRSPRPSASPQRPGKPSASPGVRSGRPSVQPSRSGAVGPG